ncbi:hypothetical protein [Gemmata sp.]|uniref:hypothetical protein n=1 Tax=Gemmata sp. TaxID=1914242 RepID=UPI003F722EA7
MNKNKRPDSETPWYRASKDAWYAWRDGRQISLGVKGKDNRPSALQAFYRLMSAESPTKRTKDKSQIDLQSVKSYNRSSNSEDTTNLTTDEINQLAQQLTERMTNKTALATTASITVREMVDAFLQAKDGEVGAGTFLGYAKFARYFKQSFGRALATSVTADTIEEDSKRPNWSPTYRADYLATIVSAYRWAVRQRLGSVW